VVLYWRSYSILGDRGLWLNWLRNVEAEFFPLLSLKLPSIPGVRNVFDQLRIFTRAGWKKFLAGQA
jgi:hypothetical protein